MKQESKPQEILDVRVLVPIQRHEKLLKLFRELPVGESFTFVNDHDPIPLYYEFKSIHGDVVGWEYLNRGGRDWTVRVTRTGASHARDTSQVATLLDLRPDAILRDKRSPRPRGRAVRPLARPDFE